MIEWFKRFLRTPEAMELAVRELNEAKRELLKAQTGRDYADAVCKYNEARIRRLETIIGVEK